MAKYGPKAHTGRVARSILRCPHITENKPVKKILIVDDKPEIRELVSVTLEIGPYQILTAENGDQALHMAQTQKPDVMLLDIQMPGGTLDGLDVCRILKN